MKNLFKLTLAAASLALLTACGGGETVSQVDGGYQVSNGTAQKGPLRQGSVITINELTLSTMQPNGKSYTFETNDDKGTFTPANITFASSYLETTAEGYFFDEISGKTSTGITYLHGLSNIASGADKAVNVNVLTSIVKNRIKKLVTVSKLTFPVARAQAQRELLNAFFIYNSSDLMPGGAIQPANFGELDLSKSRTADQILSAISGMVLQVSIANGGGIGDGLAFLNQVQTDLADDGLLNNSPLYNISVHQQILNAMQYTNFNIIASNLNRFYKLLTPYKDAELNQWADSSGGVDRVIDRYKFTSNVSNLASEVRSPEYIAGSDDLGQCFSVTTGVLYRNGVLVNSPTILISARDRLQIGLVPLNSINSPSYLQRQPTVGAVCSAMKLTTAVRVMKFSVPVAETFAGSGVGNGFSGDGGSAKLAMLSTPVGINFDLTGNLYIADVGNGRIRRITKDGAITTFAGGGISNQDGIPATQATLDNSRYVAVDKSGSIFISSVSGTVRKVDNLGIINTLHPISEIGGAKSGMVFDTQNNLYVRATAICQILKMDTLGNVTKFAGTDCGSNSGDGGQATNARFGGGESLFIDSDNNIYINTEWPERKVRKINSQGIISTVINESSLTGSPGAVAVDKKGRVYVSTFYPYSTENRILRYNANGTITTIINNSGLLGFNGDIVAPLDMLVYNPGPMAFNSDGLLYFTDVGNNRVRRVSVQ